jgi:hypothetical protein
MYLDDTLNNFLDTLKPAPDLLTNNPSLEQGKFVNDRSRYYAGRNVTVSTDGSIDGSCKTTTITVQKPDLDLIERSSGPEYGTVMEGFNGGSAVREGYHHPQPQPEPDNSVAQANAAKNLEAYNAIYTSYKAKSDEYSAALKAFNAGGTYAQSQYFDKFVRVEKTAATASPPKAATYDIYYVNNYGYLYTIPSGPSGITATSPPVPAADAVVQPKIITKIDLAGFRKPALSADKYVAVPNQALNLAGTIVRYDDTDANKTVVYVWIDIEGVAHKFDHRILSLSHTNCHESCVKKVPTAAPSSKAAFEAAINTNLIGTPITSSTFVCSELPTNVLKLRAELAGLETQLNAAASKLDQTDYSRAQTDSQLYSRGEGGGGGSSWWNPSPQPLSSSSSSSSSSQGSSSINLYEYDTLQKNMVTYDGKVGDSTLNVKSKLGYYVLWVSLMLFIIVVTFRNIANSESTESGSFMISAALLILLLIYLFNYLSDLRIGPQQMMTKAVGALPEKVSGMMKFTFT